MIKASYYKKCDKYYLAPYKGLKTIDPLSINKIELSSSDSIYNLCNYCTYGGEFGSTEKYNCPIYYALNHKEEILLQLTLPSTACFANQDKKQIKDKINEILDYYSRYDYILNKIKRSKDSEKFNNLGNIKEVKADSFYNPCNYCEHSEYFKNQGNNNITTPKNCRFLNMIEKKGVFNFTMKLEVTPNLCYYLYDTENPEKYDYQIIDDLNLLIQDFVRDINKHKEPFIKRDTFLAANINGVKANPCPF